MRRSAQTAPDSSRKLRRNLLRVAAVLVVIAAGVPAARAALAAEGVTATFTKSSDWGSGYEGKYTIHNGSSGPLTWRVEFDLPSGATISSFWDASLVRTGNHVVATGTWNGTLAAGASTSFGWIGAPGGITPTNCTINGDPCTGGSGPSVPGAPGNLRVTGTSNSSISLAWNASSGTVTGYRVYEGSTQRAQVSGTSATISGLGACTTHTYTVRAYNSAGESTASNSVTATTGGCTGVPAAPTNLRVTGSSNSSISLAWNASSGTVTGYRVYEGSTQRAQVSGTSATISGLGACTTHTYTVRAYNASGESPNSNSVTGTTTGCTGGGNKVIGYFADWGVYARNYHVKNIHTSGSASKLTHILYAFGNVTNGQCTMGDSYAAYDKAYTAAESVDGVADTWDQPLRGNFNQLRKLKQMYPHLKVIWSFGGWTWSGGFGQAVQNPTAFANSCYNLVNDPRWAGVFDGIDIDWEYPNACGLSCDSSGFGSFRTLMQALRNRFGNQLVTAAITADGTNGGKIDAADYGGAAQYVDWYMVMTYDFFGAWAPQGPTAPHSPLTCYSGIPISGFCSETAIAKLRSKGIPASKLLLGIGFYGRGWTGVSQSTPGGSASGAAPGQYEQGVNDYKVLKTSCPATGTVGGTAYAYCGNQWWSYDTPSTIAGKMNWAKSQGLGGAFFWELSGDTTNGELITAIKNGLS